MRILVVNDDGIQASGLKRLAEAAKEFGEVTVVAPNSQCSAMSAKITIGTPVDITKCDYPVPGVTAYCTSGTPADCVKVAVEYIMKDNKPDYIFSGINRGYNCGVETTYSGTVAAAMEGLLKGIPSIAFSVDYSEGYDVTDKYLRDVMAELLKKPKLTTEIWNVNFPSCPVSRLKGIKWDVTLAKHQYFPDVYIVDHEIKDGVSVKFANDIVPDALPGTDIHALLNDYVSVGKIRNFVLYEG